jgi:hypothetical protein
MLHNTTNHQTVILRPDNIEEKHWSEWIIESCVHPLLMILNVMSLAGGAPFDYLLYALPSTARRNDGRLRDGYLNRYAHLEKGGWWVSGLDPLNNWQPILWGRFKPDFPRIDLEKGKAIKYESPPQTGNRVTYFNVPDCIWDLVANRYEIKRYHCPLALLLAGRTKPLTFWEWIQLHPEIPIILCEGEKKAAALLSMGFVAIALPGIWNGRVGKQDFNEQLHPDIIPVAQADRKFIILFDYETKPKTRYAVFQATTRTAEAIAQAGCICEVATLPGPEKGVDDFIKANSENANVQLTTIINDAKSLKDYRYSFFHSHRGLSKYKPDIRVNVKYLSDAVELPESGLVVLSSDMGTGKTELLRRWRKKYPQARFLNNSHRVNLLKNLAQRLETEMYSELGYKGLAEATALSITIDSLHKLNTQFLEYGCVFIDEACQSLLHLLHSKTCKEHRAEILEILEYIVSKAKLVVIADAHMDDITVAFFLAMRANGEKPIIIKNDWRNGDRQIFWYEGKDSSSITAQIAAALMNGQKILVASDSKRYIQKLERLLQNQHHAKVETQLNPNSAPGLKIWSIHSGNSGSSENVIFIKNISTAVKEVDALLYSPSLGTGVDMCEQHFDLVFGVFHAKSQTATECAQQLYRYRLNVPIHIWVAPRPQMGYQETNAHKIEQNLLQSNEVTAFLLRIDRVTGQRGVEKDWALQTYCQLQATRNFSINNLREDLSNLLKEMGNIIIPVGGENDRQTLEKLKQTAQILDSEYCCAVVNAQDISATEYRQRQSRDYLNPQETFECEKHRLQESYGMEVTTELVEMDNNGKLLRAIASLEAMLTPPKEMVFTNGRYQPSPPQMVVEKDLWEREKYLLCFDWANYSAQWLVRSNLGLQGILQRLIAGEQMRSDDPELVRMAEIAVHFTGPIKTILGFTVPENCQPMWLLGVLLDNLGLKLIRCKQGARGQQVNVYTLSQPEWEFAQRAIACREQKRKQKELRRTDKPTTTVVEYGFDANSSTVSTPPPNSIETPLGRGMDTTGKGVDFARYQPDDGDSTPIEDCIRLFQRTCNQGVEAIKGRLSRWSQERRWGVLLLWEEIASDELADLLRRVPELMSWLDQSV